jgi:ketosteroid isomerase-like protein/N-acetylglutamate synthase-like GNAT family acetyltransferase
VSENVDKTKDFITAYNRRDFDAALEWFHPDVDWVLPALQQSDSCKGPEEVRRFWENLDETFDELRLDAQEFVDAGDLVGVRLRYFGRGKESGLELDTEMFHQLTTFRDGWMVRLEYFQSWPEVLDALGPIRRCDAGDRDAILAIVNAAAEAYRGVIPADRWREPYMPPDELDAEIASGVVFWGYEADGALVGVMGIQSMSDVDLIRHAYVAPEGQRQGVGGALLEHLERSASRRILVGTWAAADWAIGFYRRHSFELVSPEQKDALLERYWTIPARQVESSVVLAKPPV